MKIFLFKNRDEVPRLEIHQPSSTCPATELLGLSILLTLIVIWTWLKTLAPKFVHQREHLKPPTKKEPSTLRRTARRRKQKICCPYC